MIRRAIPAVVVVSASLAGIVAVGRDDVVQPDSVLHDTRRRLDAVGHRQRGAHRELVLPRGAGQR